jgi:hypothetical protein
MSVYVSSVGTPARMGEGRCNGFVHELSGIFDLKNLSTVVRTRDFVRGVSMGFFVASSHRTILKTVFASALAVGMSVSTSQAASSASIIGALRISGIITGGSMPTNSADFATMTTQVSNGDYYGAALTAVDSPYGASYLLRRLAFQMQNAGYTASSVTDSDATAFILAHFIGATGSGTTASIKKLWSDNQTCLVKNSAGVMVHVADLTDAEKITTDFTKAISCTTGQTAADPASATVPAARITIPVKHVGGYVTLSDRAGDNSIAQVGATAGTNLRYIENIWMVATGLDLLSFASTDAHVQDVPRFVPENDSHFLNGNGQTACIACHGGGLAAITHGYATIADLFDFDAVKGLMYIATPTTGTMKSLGSDPTKRAANLACTSATAVCNPDSSSATVLPTQNWDLATTWGARGMLTTLGWNGATSGQGLNTLGAAIGQANIVYTNLVKRVIKEVCPLGAVPATDLTAINSLAQSSDDIKLVIAKVASNPACR